MITNKIMKFAFLVGEFPSPSETFILNQVTGLIERGHEVDIYALSPETEKIGKIHPDVERYELLRRTYYVPSIPKFYPVRLAKALVLFLAHFPQHSRVLLKSLNTGQFGRQASSLRVLFNAVSVLNKSPQYDVVMCHFGSNGVRGDQLRKLGLIQGKLCTVFHGFDLTGYLQREGNDAYNNLFQKGDLFLPISDRWKQRIIEMGCPIEKIQVHRMGIDCNKFKFINRQLFADEKVRIVSVCRLTEKKGLEYGIRAIAQLQNLYPNLQYTIVGDGLLRPVLEALITELNVTNKVHLLGWRQRDEVIETLNQSHIFLAPSVTACNGDQEGIPVAIMEAMAMGMPVVSTLHSGIPELVENGISGILVPERDVDRLSEALADLINHPESWTAMGKAGRENISLNFHIEKLNDQLVEICRTLVKE